MTQTHFLCLIGLSSSPPPTVSFDRFDLKSNFVFIAEYNVWATEKLVSEHVSV
jgi:hypothetical protein